MAIKLSDTKLLLSTAILSGILILWLGVTLYQSLFIITQENRRAMRLTELCGRMRLYDETGVMSDEMFAVTGEERWRLRCDTIHLQPIFDTVLAELKPHVPPEFITDYVQATSVINDSIVRVEDRIWAAGKRGDLVLAQRLLHSDEYQKPLEKIHVQYNLLEQKAEFIVRESLRGQRRQALVTVIAFCIGLPFIIFGWRRTFSGLQRLRQELTSANTTLEEKLKEVEREAQRALTAEKEAVAAKEYIQAQQRHLTLHVEEMIDKIHLLSGGNLAIHLATHDTGELGNLFREFNQSIAKIRELILEVTNAAAVTMQVSADITVNSERLSAGFLEQTRQSRQVAEAIESLTAMVQNNAAHIAKVSEQASEARAYANNGGTVMRETIDSMNTIARVVVDAVGIIEGLAKSNVEISEIIGTVKAIAEQTNLLALNASIESARAGTHGRGFAVVADEVRKLAERTAHAVKEISDTIHRTQTDTVNIISLIQNGSSHVDHSRHATSNALLTQEQIIRQIGEVASVMRQLTEISRQESSALRTINHNTEQMETITELSAHTTRGITKSVSNLNVVTERLYMLINQFTVSSQDREVQYPPAIHSTA